MVMKTRTTKKATNAIDSHNERIRAEHAAMRDKIMARRPNWDRAKLEDVRFSYGLGQDGATGLSDILDAITAADKLEALFAKVQS